jgi:DNA-binding response OmpR family regulator
MSNSSKQPDDQGDILQVGELRLDLVAREVCRGEECLALSPKLYDLLLVFMRHPGHILSRKELMQIVWETDYMGDTRTLYVHVRMLRSKIEVNPSSPKYLRTIRGMGYRFGAPDRSD